MKKIIVIISLCLIFITSCATSKSDIEMRKPDTVSFQHYFSGALSGGINDMVISFNEQQSKHVLKAIPIDHEAFKVSILETLYSGTPPDLYSYWAGAKTFSILEYLEPIDDLWLEGGLENIFSSDLIKSACQYDNHYYMVPITQHYVGFFYSKEVFEKYNLEIPTTWDELMSIADKLIQNNITPFEVGAVDKWPMQFWFDYILLNSAGYDYRDQLMKGTANYNDMEVYQVFSILSNMIEKGYFNKDASEISWEKEPIERLVAGESAMTLMGTWMINIIESEPYNYTNDDYGFFAFPTMNDQVPSVALGPIDGIILPKESINIDGAKEALLFIASKENQTIMSTGSGAFSPSSEVDEESYTPIQLEVLNYLNQKQKWAFNYDLATEPEIAELGLSMFKDFLDFPEAYEFLLEELNINVKRLVIQ